MKLQLIPDMHQIRYVLQDECCRLTLADVGNNMEDNASMFFGIIKPLFNDIYNNRLGTNTNRLPLAFNISYRQPLILPRVSTKNIRNDGIHVLNSQRRHFLGQTTLCGTLHNNVKGL
jgi:hypothetical protein